MFKGLLTFLFLLYKNTFNTLLVSDEEYPRQSLSSKIVALVAMDFALATEIEFLIFLIRKLLKYKRKLIDFTYIFLI